jgi:hypothetical protein
MTTLEAEIMETLRSLDPLRAKAFERAIHELLLVVRPEAKTGGLVKSPVAVDANGWPVGYWESVVGCWADLEFEAPSDPPPAPHPY